MLYDRCVLAKSNLREACTICFRDVRSGDLYVRTDSKTAHYKCAKRHHWQKRPKQKKVVLEFASVNRPIKVVKYYER